MLLKCKCGAKHDPNIRWQRVRYPPNDTSGAYYPGSLIDAGHCPACIKPDGVGYSTRQLKLISLDEALAKVNPHANT